MTTDGDGCLRLAVLRHYFDSKADSVSAVTHLSRACTEPSGDRVYVRRVGSQAASSVWNAILKSLQTLIPKEKGS